MEQLVSVARLPFVTRIPCAPPSILGLGSWQDIPVVIVDLRRVIDPGAPRAAAPTFPDYLHVVVKVVCENEVGLVGCPIQPGGQIVSVPLVVPGVTLPAGIAVDAVHRAVLIGDSPTLLLNMLRLPALLASLQPLLQGQPVS
jgi:chemotaxis signal transduction protein